MNDMPDKSEPDLGVGACAVMACLLEAIAPKVGNVHRGADFEDLGFTDFAISAAACGSILDEASSVGVGSTVLRLVRATKRWVGSNTNLGIALLLSPLAAAPSDATLERGLERVLSRLDETDSQNAYLAIREANPGGLGESPQWDVRDAAPPSLMDAMRLAADRDLIALQYVSCFRDVFELADGIERYVGEGESLESAIVLAQLSSLAERSDSLILRKCGSEVAEEAAMRAAHAIAARGDGEESFWQALGHLDFWLRSDENRRNPGATADLLAAALFVLLRDGRLGSPLPTKMAAMRRARMQYGENPPG